MNIFKRPMLYAALVCCVVAAISLYQKLFLFCIITITVIAFLILVCFKKFKYLTALIAVLLFSVSLYSQFTEIDDISKMDYSAVSGQFLVTSEPILYDEFTMVTLSAVKCDKIDKNTKCMVFDNKKTIVKMGDIITANITLSAIRSHEEFMLSNFSNGIYATGNVESITKSNDTNFFYHTAGKVRAYIKKTITSHFEGDTAGFLLALTTGDKTLISEDFSNNVKTTGISHVIVVSGMHLSIIMSAVFWFLDRMFYNRYIKSILSVTFVVFLFAICGFTMSITRAGAMFIIAGLAPVFSRDNDSLSSLLTAVTIVLISAPFAVFNISFLLSVLSTFAIIWIVPFYYRIIINRFNISSKFIRVIINVTLCSIFAVAFTLPVTIVTFGFMSIVAPITNLFITYFVTMVLVVNILSLVLFAIPIIEFVAYPLFYVVGLCVDFVIYLVNLIAKLPITVAVLPKNAFWWSIGLITLIVGYMYFYNFKKKRSDLNVNRI